MKLFSVLFFVCMLLPLASCSINKKDHVEMDIPLTEDLMREHGILRRVLLMYEEIIGRVETNKPLPIDGATQAVEIIKTFIQEYHEKLEEDYIFPLVKTGEKVALVKTLLDQHNKGRKITAQLQTLLAKKTLDKKSKATIKKLMQQFITMYRPHAAREDTQLFPLIRSLLSAKAFEKLGDKFEDLEHQLFGKHGFEDMEHKVTALEKELGIYRLEQFTPAT